MEWDNKWEEIKCIIKIHNKVKKKMEEGKYDFVLYLLQRFNDYEVPLQMTAEKVRELIIEFTNDFDREEAQ